MGVGLRTLKVSEVIENGLRVALWAHNLDYLVGPLLPATWRFSGSALPYL